MDVLKQLLGRLHPVLVHLPIGFIILALLLQWYDRKTKQYVKVIGLIYLWAGISALLTCITGYLQYLGEGYTFETVKWHLWLGVATTIFSFLMYFRYGDRKQLMILDKVPIVGFAFAVFLLISFTGHLGGRITHGEDYLLEPLPNNLKSALGFDVFEEKEITLNEENWEDALIFEDVIKPILNNNCVSCHNPRKTKGELQLHTKEAILKGGENGAVILPKNPEKSELFIRVNLPKSHDDHMPPEGKKQPSKEEIRLLGAWIDAEHPFEGTIRDVGLKKELFSSFFPKKNDNDHPDIEIGAASPDSIQAIEETGVHVDLISKASNFLSVSCINKPSFTDSEFNSLIPIKDQIAVLDLGGTQVTDSIFGKLKILPNLTILKLDNTKVSGNGIENLGSLEHLKSINLTASRFESTYLERLEAFQGLNKVYLYRTLVDGDRPPTLKKGQIYIDYGDYELPPIASDSIIY